MGQVKMKDCKLSHKNLKLHITKNFLSFDKNGGGLLENFYAWTKSSHQICLLTFSLTFSLFKPLQ